MKNYSSFTIYVIFIVIVQCSLHAQSVSKLRKIGNEFEKNGSIVKASEYYLKALDKRSSDKKSIAQLKKIAPMVMDKYAQDANKAYTMKKYERVLEIYDLSKDFLAELDDFDVYVSTPSILKDLKKNTDIYFANQHYEDGKRNIQNGLLEEAIKDLESCISYDAYYKDARNLLDKVRDDLRLIRAEKYYYSGVTKLSKKEFRSAYKDFGECLSNKSPYKDAYQLRAQALEKGLAKIGVLNVKNLSNYRNGIEKTLYTNIVNNIENKRSPFIEIVNSSRFNNGSGNYSGSLTESSAILVGREMGLEFILIAKVLDVDKSGGKLTSKDVDAYELYYVQNSSGKKTPKGRKVKFKLYEGASRVTYRVDYKLISTKTNQIIKSSVISESASDQVKYAFYKGDHEKLCVTDPAENGDSILGSFLTNVTMVDQKLFKSRKSLKTPYDLHKPVFETISKKIAHEVYIEINEN
ncbi:hypothetical protein [Winogradskyella poriferorum]|uniref:hypothetical protein n=1 Tax=Winogradskyella poriferorum TaxID=307627 RepID=UPI003D65F554